MKYSWCFGNYYICRNKMIRFFFSSSIVKLFTIKNRICFVPCAIFKYFKKDILHMSFFFLHLPLYPFFTGYYCELCFFFFIWPPTSWKCNFNKKMIVLEMMSQFSLWDNFLFGKWVHSLIHWARRYCAYGKIRPLNNTDNVPTINGLPNEYVANMSSIIFTLIIEEKKRYIIICKIIPFSFNLFNLRIL